MEEKSHKWVYITIVVVIVALMVAGVALYRQEKQTEAAKAEATEFVTALKAAGLPAPTVEEAVRLFGTDGGPFAGNPEADLEQAEYGWWHGHGRSRQPPVPPSRRLHRGGRGSSSWSTAPTSWRRSTSTWPASTQMNRNDDEEDRCRLTCQRSSRA